MASAMIHLAVAKNLAKDLKIDNLKDYYLGAIAPDIAKQIGRTKQLSHFLYNSLENIPNIEMFIEKYPNFKKNSFDLGYFIHLYTDKIWFSKFMSKIIAGDYIKLIDGTIIKSTPDEITNIIYNDYSNLNIKLLDEYDMDLSLFYEEFIPPKTTIEEIPTNKLNILIEKMGIIIENTKEAKPYTFDIFPVKDFIEESNQTILNILKDY